MLAQLVHSRVAQIRHTLAEALGNAVVQDRSVVCLRQRVLSTTHLVKAMPRGRELPELIARRRQGVGAAPAALDCLPPAYAFRVALVHTMHAQAQRHAGLGQQASRCRWLKLGKEGVSLAPPIFLFFRLRKTIGRISRLLGAPCFGARTQPAPAASAGPCAHVPIRPERCAGQLGLLSKRVPRGELRVGVQRRLRIPAVPARDARALAVAKHTLRLE